MLALISFILVLIGCFNWLCIGILQFDFVAGIFGSQANIFSRIVYFVIGVAAIIVCANLIKNKGKLTFNLKKLKKENFKKEPVFVPESSNDMAQNHNNQSATYYKNNTEVSNSISDRNQTEASNDMANNPNSPLHNFKQDYQNKNHQ